MNSNHYAISSEYGKMKSDNKHLFLLLTKELLVLQRENNFEMLHDVPNTFDNYFTNGTEISDTIICEVYQKHNIFSEIKKMVTKTGKIGKMPKVFSDYLQSDESIKCVKNMLRSVVLVNLIRKSISKKNVDDIGVYQLFNKLMQLKYNGVSILGLDYLLSVTDESVKTDFITNTYTYSSTNVRHLYEYITEEEYNEIHELFYLFR